MQRGLGSQLVCAVLTAAMTMACVGSARTEPDYLADMVNSSKAVVSSLETARLAADAVAQRRSTAPYTSLVMSESETDTDSVITSFSSVQPPSPELDAARAELITTMEEAASLLGDLRIAAFRDDSRTLVRIAKGIPDVRERLKAIARAAQS